MRIPARLSRAVAADVVLASVFALAGQLDVWVRSTVEGPRPENALLLSLVAWPLVARRRWPNAVLVTIAAGIALQSLAVSGHPPSGLLFAGPMIVGAYSVGAHAAWSRRSLAALVALAVAYNGVYAAAQGLGGSFTAVVSNLVWLLVPTGAWALGWYVRRRRLAAAASVETLRLERDQERERLAVLVQERLRMARELHDILAHSVSLMGVQAGAVEEVLARDVELARPLLRSIQQTARESVADLRRLLSMLRGGRRRPVARAAAWRARARGPRRAVARGGASGRAAHGRPAASAPARYRAGGVPDRAGGTDERAQACEADPRRGRAAVRACPARRRRAKRRRLLPRERDAGMGWSGCASASRSTAARSTPASGPAAASTSAPPFRLRRRRHDPRPDRRRPGTRSRRLPADPRGTRRTSRWSARPATAARRSRLRVRSTPTSS